MRFIFAITFKCGLQNSLFGPQKFEDKGNYISCKKLPKIYLSFEYSLCNGVSKITANGFMSY